MRIEEVRVLPATPREAFDYLSNPITFDRWMAGLIEIHGGEEIRWCEPGDRIGFASRLLGHRLEGDLILEELRTERLVRFRARIPALGTARQNWLLAGEGEHAVGVTLVYESREPASFFGRLLEPTVICEAIRRDVHATLSNLEDIFLYGLFDGEADAAGVAPGMAPRHRGRAGAFPAPRSPRGSKDDGLAS